MIIVACVPLPSSAAGTLSISMRNGAVTPDYQPIFDPRAPTPVIPGTTLTWTSADATAHTVTAYYGAAFASGSIAKTESFSALYSGGTVLYRCLYHASLDTRVSPPACSGMCGAIHDASQDLSAPAVSIRTQSGFVFTGAVRIDGVASDNRAVMNVRVKLTPIIQAEPLLPTKQAFSEDSSENNPCVGCYGPNVLWTFRQSADVVAAAPPLTLPPGQYRVDAQAVDPQGNTADASPISIYVIR